MTVASKPPNEEMRLEALRGFEILDTPAENAYDDLVRLASYICETPIAAVSFIDRDRQWFKAKVGLDVPETKRGLAFCAHAILTPEDTLIVPDASLDARFSDNPLVTGDPKIRFYAGVPLVTEHGLGLGTLCVIDHKPKELSAAQLKALTVLRNQVIRELELHKKNIALSEANKKLEQALADKERAEDALRERDALLFDLLENASDLIQRVSPNGQFLYVNRAWRETLGYSNAEAATLQAFDVVHPDQRGHCMEVFAQALAGKPIGNFETAFVTKDGRSVPLQGNINCLFAKSKPISTRGIFRKITEQPSKK